MQLGVRHSEELMFGFRRARDSTILLLENDFT